MCVCTCVCVLVCVCACVCVLVDVCVYLWMCACRYRYLGEMEVVDGLVDRNCVVPETRMALDAAVRGDQFTALSIYNSLLRQHDKGHRWEVQPSVSELCAWDDGRAEAQVQLRMWTEVMADAMANVVDDDGVRDLSQLYLDDMKREHNLGLFMRAALRVPNEFGGELAQVVRACWCRRDALQCRRHVPLRLLCSQLDGALANPTARLWLKERHGADVACAYILRGDLVRADVAVQEAMDQVLQAWRSLHPLSTAARMLTLRSVQRLVEMRDFLRFRRRTEPTSPGFVDGVVTLVRRWRNRYVGDLNHVFACYCCCCCCCCCCCVAVYTRVWLWLCAWLCTCV